MQENYKGGLLPLPKDERDRSHSKKFGSLGAAQIPLVDFDVDTPLSIEDQIDLDFCTGYSSSEMNGDLHDEDFCPLWQMAKIKQVRNEWKEWGADLRDACKALKKFGSLPKRFSPFTYKAGKTTDRDRDFLANWENWPKELDDIAAQYKIGAYYIVDGPNDFFDNIRSTMWIHRDEDKSILGGLIWSPKWSKPIIPNVTGSYEGSGHAINHKGQKIINNTPYIKTQNSYGVKSGDKGFYFFPRSVINENAAYGAFYISTVAETEKIVSLLSVIVDLYRKIIGLLTPEPTPAPVNPPVEPIEPKKDYIHAMALAIQEFEGWAPPGGKDRTGKVHPNGTASYRRNNPGNIKDTDGNFRVFTNYETGFAHLENYILRACTGKHGAYTPEMSIREFFGVYSPDGNEIESNYASFVCNEMSNHLLETVFPSKKLKELV